jgi:hypothetical protein
MIALAAGTGFRKAEVALPSGVEFDDRRLRRAFLLWEIDGVIVADPSPEALRGLVLLATAYASGGYRYSLEFGHGD